jgi:hypothetical protein
MPANTASPHRWRAVNKVSQEVVVAERGANLRRKMVMSASAAGSRRYHCRA